MNLISKKAYILFFLVGCFLTASPISFSKTLFQYGNFCGAGTSDFTKEPIDVLDAICKAHDLCCSCGDIYKITQSFPYLPDACPSYCNVKVIKKLDRYIRDNCGITKINKGINRAKACAVARGGQGYTIAIGFFNIQELTQCTINRLIIHNSTTCTKEFQRCVRKIKWPRDSQLKLN